MFSKSLLLFFIVTIILYMNDFIIIASIYFQIFVLIFVLTLYYTHNKFVLFCKDKIENEKREQHIDTNENTILKRINGYSSSPFLEACKRRDTDLVQQLINSGVNIFETNENGDGAIHSVVYYLVNNPEERNVKCLWTLHNAGCPINLKNVEGFTPLQIAAKYGHVCLIKWLIRKGADINMKPNPFVIAMDAGHKQAAALLLAIKYNLTQCNIKQNTQV